MISRKSIANDRASTDRHPVLANHSSVNCRASDVFHRISVWVSRAHQLFATRIEIAEDSATRQREKMHSDRWVEKSQKSEAFSSFCQLSTLLQASHPSPTGRHD